MLKVDGAAARRSVDMVVVGDASCGKTSLITTLVSAIFPESVPRVLQQVRVPPEETADGIALSITDTSSAQEDRAQTLKQVAQADVVLVVYSSAEEATFARVRSYWLPEITKVFKGSIIVVGNKSDLVTKSEEHAAELRGKMNPLLGDFRQVDACTECSAKLNINVSDVFQLAQQAVVYPIAPLFNTQTRELAPRFVGSLRRVFRIFDQDKDDMLSDAELIDFQETCFGARLQPTDIEDVKTMLEAEGADNVAAAGITFKGFLRIHQKFIERNRAETAWLVLRQFGFNDRLQLMVPRRALSLERNNRTRHKVAPFPGVVRDQSVELSKAAQAFLDDIFHQFDRDRDQALSSAELDEIFSICPGGMRPWTASRFATAFSQDHAGTTANNSDAATTTGGDEDPNELLTVDEALSAGAPPAALSYIDDFPFGTRTDANGNISLSGWRAQWHMITLLQPHLTLLFLYFLGFDSGKERALVLTRKRAVENACNDLQRHTVRAFVFGAQGVGKSSLLDALTGGGVAAADARTPSSYTFSSEYNLDEDARRKRSCRNVVGRVRSKSSTGGATTVGASGAPAPTRHFVLTEVAAEDDALEEALANDMVDCDLAIMMFDSTNPSSVDWLAGLQKRIPESVPLVFLATKVDLAEAERLLGETQGSGKGAAAVAAAAKAKARMTKEDMLAEDPAHISQAIEEATMLCASYSLPNPEPVALVLPKNRLRLGKLFELLLSAALRPDLARPVSEEKRAQQRRQRLIRSSLRISLVVSVLVGAGLLAHSFLGSTRKQSASESSQGTSLQASSAPAPRVPADDFRYDYDGYQTSSPATR
ncbi:Mitochondrial Rho GTPase [Hondaea fermentalgiana]|uniref:Mitochondrial Rho GTPase n=1 Tax=Hondaea fermentalgiana TaxID=2315210 RepID=A0A2R5GUF8_9STRA|nr:Mitochondrial Rho GTPase [Hondaea fermentalgiana]|eukprot:GBG31524.1 Mitochondrial Rho GTPase [Hondaea fermentalgiana]